MQKRRLNVKRMLLLSVLKILPEISVWKAVSVGDCCLFIIRDDKLIEKFPIEVDSDFDNTPSLIGSVFCSW